MGYCIDQRGDNIFIATVRHAGGLAAIKAAHVANYHRAGGGSWGGANSLAEGQAIIDAQPEWKRQYCSVYRRSDKYGESCANPNGFSTEIPHYSWVSDEDVMGAETFEQALRAWRWDSEHDDDGNIVALIWEGEKSSEDIDVVLQAIAPFVESHVEREPAYIEMQGEEGEVWRWIFEDGKVREVYAELTWPESERT
jgi:hypothetical protein